MSASRRALARARIGAVATTVALAIAACGASGTPGPASGGAASTEDTKVAVKAFDYGFEPSGIEVSAGEVTFSVTNTGTVEHEFEVFKGDAVVDEVEGLVPGLTRDLTVTLEPGDYTFVCKLTGHEEAGMKGSLTVTQ